MSSPDYSATIRGPQGWISTTGSSLSSTKTTAFVRSLTSDLQLGHKKYYRVYLQPLYTTPPESSPFDHPPATMCQSKFRQNYFTHLTCHKGCYRHCWNRFSPTNIVDKESTSSDVSRALMHCQNFLQRHLHASRATCAFSMPANIIWHITPS